MRNPLFIFLDWLIDRFGSGLTYGVLFIVVCLFAFLLGYFG